MKYQIILSIFILLFTSCKKEEFESPTIPVQSKEEVELPEVPSENKEEVIVENKLPFAAIGRKFTYARTTVNYSDTTLDTGVVEILEFQPPIGYVISDPKRIFNDKNDILIIDSVSVKYINDLSVIAAKPCSGFKYFVPALDKSVLCSETRVDLPLADNTEKKVIFSREYGIIHFRNNQPMSLYDQFYTLIKIED